MSKQIPLFGVVGGLGVEAAALQVLRSGKIASGEFVPRFEAGIAAITGQPHIVSTADMTSAMFLALYLAGVGPGDEVLTTAFSCMATNSAIAQLGATPVWVDVLPKSVEVDLDDAARKISSKTKAFILYHVAGYPGPARQLAGLCRARGVALIEDCDNALFATRNGVHVGGEGDFAVYSFYPNRQINCTEGGALACRSPEQAARARRLCRFGIDSASFRTAFGEINPASDIPEIGWALTMNNLCAAIGVQQLSSAGERVAAGRANVAQLERRVAQIGGFEVVAPANAAEPAYWVMLLFAERRDAVLRALKEQGVAASSLHQRNDVYSGFKSGDVSPLPNTDYLQQHVLAIPCGWWLEPQDLDAIGDALAKAADVAHA